MTVPLPQGFRAAGVSCGIKVAANTLDVALLVSDRPCAAAGVFTTNQVVGAPVITSRERLPASGIRGVVLNSGNSNACTGQRGLDDAHRMTALVAEHVGCQPTDILVCSTGIIGRFLPMDKIERGIESAARALGPDSDSFHNAARAMMTTDTVPKQVVRVLETDDGPITVSGVCKGAAMIAPNMATMLGVVMTDAALTPEQARQMLTHAVERSFNCISVDGHMSTSDTVLLLANGAAANGKTAGHLEHLPGMIDDVCRELSRMIIRDAEGAEHFITIEVTGAASREDATRIAKTVADSALVKTAVTGNDPNWGRIVSAAGYSGVPFREEQVSLVVNGFPLYESGRPVDFDEKAVSDSMRTGEVLIELKFQLGTASTTFWTSDLTAEYVRLNADYTT